MNRWDDDDFEETDEEIQAAWDEGEKGETVPPEDQEEEPRHEPEPAPRSSEANVYRRGPGGALTTE